MTLPASILCAIPDSLGAFVVRMFAQPAKVDTWDNNGRRSEALSTVPKGSHKLPTLPRKWYNKEAITRSS